MQRARAKKRSGKIEKVLNLAVAEERRYGQVLGRTRTYLDSQIARLDELNSYRQSYAEQSRQAANMHPAHWCDFRNFIGRLDRAVLTQEQIVKDSEQNLEIHRRRWLEKRQHVKSLGQVLNRYRLEETANSDRLQQRALDDLSKTNSPYQNRP